MNTSSQRQDYVDGLLQRKSLLIIQAQFQKALEQNDEAVRLFLEAALLEEKIVVHFQQEGRVDDAAISLFSAASCYKSAGHISKAVDLAEKALALNNSVDFAREIQQFLDKCGEASVPVDRRIIYETVQGRANQQIPGKYALNPLVAAFGLSLLSVVVYFVLLFNHDYTNLFAGKEKMFVEVSGMHFLIFAVGSIVMIVLMAAVVKNMRIQRNFPLRNVFSARR